jgi:hypothetical protein
MQRIGPSRQPLFQTVLQLIEGLCQYGMTARLFIQTTDEN